ncbi:hypothetical protein L6250_01995 [Candidatus Parcubacteria bacterium]|nr:hypothetical protein [Patescibacteria group bacterium]MBU4466637.1 hypothetical protein [Patescibacteria group bacterium]MCG2688387.1 hypothetical protein [Candidatus Parcubacteria bacterium]
MTKFVIKTDGTKEIFDAGKVERAIRAAAHAVDFSEERIQELIKNVLIKVFELIQDNEEVAAADIKKVVLSELDILEPSVSASWRDYDATKVRD